MPCQLERFRVDDVDVRGRDRQDYTVGLCDVLGNEVTGLLLDVAGLVSDGNLCRAVVSKERRQKIMLYWSVTGR
jgi:hypothetical protein